MLCRRIHTEEEMKRGLSWLLHAMKWIFMAAISLLDICEHKLQPPELVWTHVPGDSEKYGARVLRKAKPGEMKVSLIRSLDTYRFRYRYSSGRSEASKVFMSALETQIPSICNLVNRSVPGCPEQIEVYIKTRRRGWSYPRSAWRRQVS
jgi:hypothetical protein